MSDHPNKHIREAVQYALAHGWTLRKAGPRAHAWGRLYCPLRNREGCQHAVYSTPRARSPCPVIFGVQWMVAPISPEENE